MKNIFYSWLTPVLAIAVTVLGFFLLKSPEPTAIFWINLVYAVCLEVLFFVWLRWGRLMSRTVDEQTPYYRIFLGVGTLYYIIAAVVWMVFFFLCATETGRQIIGHRFKLQAFLDNFPEMSTRIYLFGILILTVAWIVIASIVGRHDAVYNTQQTALENATEQVRDIVAELKDMAAQHSNETTARQWKMLILEAESTPPAKMAQAAEKLLQKAKQLIGE